MVRDVEAVLRIVYKLLPLIRALVAAARREGCETEATAWRRSRRVMYTRLRALHAEEWERQNAQDD